MALDLTGIENVEFYSGHYLDAVLEGDLKSVFKQLEARPRRRTGKRLPQELLAGLANTLLHGPRAGRRRARRGRALARRPGLPRPPARGARLPVQARAPSRWTATTVCPVLLSLQRDGNPFLWIVDAPFTAEGGRRSPRRQPAPGAAAPEAAEAPSCPTPPGASCSTTRSSAWTTRRAGSSSWPAARRCSSSATSGPRAATCASTSASSSAAARPTALRAIAGLLHRDVLAPDAGLCLHDTLDENSHKHAYAVSGDLKHGVRRAVELLANEAVWYRREVQKQASSTRRSSPRS